MTERETENLTSTTCVGDLMAQEIDILKDERVDCYSVLDQLTVEEYLAIVKETFQNQGGLEGQRDTLKTTTAIRIRKRMIKDIEAGAVLPPVVLGVIVSEGNFLNLESLDKNSFLELIRNIPKDDISIIDGMQRTTALIAALNNTDDIATRKIRIEYWIACKVNSLTYRMLVLNTGQVPWNIRRQIEIVFRSNIKELKGRFPSIEIMEIDDGRRRSKAGQFQANNIIELFLVFGARKEKVELQEKLADEFTRQDFIESAANPEFTSIFYDVINYLAKLDVAISNYKDEDAEGYFKEGKDLFSSQPACVGFVTAIALRVLGRPGLDHDPETQNEQWTQIRTNIDKLLERLSQLNDDEIGQFLDFQTLNEVIRKKSGKASYHEREVFFQAFKVLIEEKFTPPSMTPCWRAL